MANQWHGVPPAFYISTVSGMADESAGFSGSIQCTLYHIILLYLTDNDVIDLHYLKAKRIH